MDLPRLAVPLQPHNLVLGHPQETPEVVCLSPVKDIQLPKEGLLPSVRRALNLTELLLALNLPLIRAVPLSAKLTMILKAPLQSARLPKIRTILMVLLVPVLAVHQ